ncbi:MAG: aminotransferase class I/II-fold pyridoxal phosphate-dependent enzyme [Caldilineaceae bacterium]|nr:aminotransferase class I/II-fold pyridoxal phosphate-dependent enzyme [Caldilineaceae bacterium]
MSNQPSAAASARAFVPANRVRGFGTTVFAEFSAMALQYNAVNLGQGFPNFPAPDFIKRAAQEAIEADLNQYARGAGQIRLVNALAETYGPLFGRELDPLQEIVITTGATEGIFATMQGLVNPGDEVILIEPFYDSYSPSVIMAGGTPVYVPLRATEGTRRASEWWLDMDELAAAFSPRTRLLVLNTPMNPIGKIFSRTELAQIAALVQQHDVLVLSDEVYEWMVYPEPDGAPVEHVRLATLPGMWERTLTLGSAGKTFSVTGWKIGWAIGPAPLVHAVLMAHQWIPFTVATPLQEAVATALEQAPKEDYYQWLATTYQAKRDKLLVALEDVGLTPVRPDGSYFVLVATGHLPVPVPEGTRRDVAVARWFTTNVGVTAIPPSPFYSPDHQYLTDNLARFCFCKTDEMLDEAARRFRAKLG